MEGIVAFLWQQSVGERTIILRYAYFGSILSLLLDIVEVFGAQSRHCENR